jgi:hypothetical protein
MKDPQHWLEDERLDPEARKLLAVGRDLDPTTDEIDNLWGALVGLGPIGSGGESGPTSPGGGESIRPPAGLGPAAGASKAAGVLSIFSKPVVFLGLTLSVGGAVAVGGLSYWTGQGEVSSASSVETTSESPSSLLPPDPNPPSTVAVDRPPESEASDVPPLGARAPAVVPIDRQTRAAKPRAPGTRPTGKGRDRQSGVARAIPTGKPALPSKPAPSEHRSKQTLLAQESALLERARRALQSGNPKQALQTLSTASQRFPNGVLTQEREALWIEAMSAVGRTQEASDRARAFQRDYPDSPLADRVGAAAKPHEKR